MDLMISEIQITCIILMGLITLIFMFVLPNHEIEDKIFKKARKLLQWGTFMITVHFILQYFLQKQNPSNLIEIRTTINLLFGIPLSICFYLSYLYLLRQGKIKKSEWLYGPIVYILSIMVLTLGVVFSPKGFTIQTVNYMMAILYALTLIYYSLLQLKEYTKIIKDIKDGQGTEKLPLIRSTRWSLFFMVLIAFGLPLMTFNNHLLTRSLYGILSISSAFFYIFNFIIYGVKYNPNGGIKTYSNDNCSNTSIEKLDDAKIKQIKEAFEKFKGDEQFLRPSITLKEVADLMGVSANHLRIWLQGTEYEKFNNWINVLRINKSKELMSQNPNTNIEEIAERCGFCDRSYFSRLFSKQEGITPAKWMREHSTTTQ